MCPVSDLYIPAIDLPILLQQICGPILGIYKSLTDTEIGIESAQFPEMEYIKGNFVAVHGLPVTHKKIQKLLYDIFSTVL